MPEQSSQTRNELIAEKYAAVGDLVIQAAQDAQAKLEVMETELFNSVVGGRATQKEIQERMAETEHDMRILGAMAAHVDPAYKSMSPYAASEPITPPVRQISPNNSDKPETKAKEETKRLVFRDEERRAEFNANTIKLVKVMASRGNSIGREGNASAGITLRGYMGVDDGEAWGNYASRLKKEGILYFERKEGGARWPTRAYIDCERVRELIQIGDLPADLTDELDKLNGYESPQEDDEVEHEISNESDNGKPLPGGITTDGFQSGLRSIHTRGSGAAVHARAKGA